MTGDPTAEQPIGTGNEALASDAVEIDRIVSTSASDQGDYSIKAVPRARR